MYPRRVSRIATEELTKTSTFLLTLQLEWAFTIFLTVPRGYIFCPGAILLSSALTSCSSSVKLFLKSGLVLLTRRLNFGHRPNRHRCNGVSAGNVMVEPFLRTV